MRNSNCPRNNSIQLIRVTTLALALTVMVGCQTGRYGGGMGQQNYGGGMGQQNYGGGFGTQPMMAPPTQPPSGMQGMLPGMQPNGMQNTQYNRAPQFGQPMQGAIPQFGRNIANRFANGFVNRGIGSVVDSAIRMTGL